ncbi:hypothetical protein AB4037_29315 [Labrys sp. KB_33_2]|uniref:hypothetical protein n=1 Tax=Labrys sp. KB_33_2 TaxID=3237479 RepID=UPI003F9340B2
MRFGLGFVAAKSAALPVVGTYRSQLGQAAGASLTLSNVDIGTASASRLVVVLAMGLNTALVANPTCTIGGIAATLVANQQNALSGTSDNTCIFAAFVPTGATATVVVTFGASMNRSHASVYTIDNAKSVAPDTTAKLVLKGQTSGGAKNITLNGVLANSFAIGYCHTYTSSVLTHTWSAPYVTDVNAIANANSRCSSASNSEAVAGNKTLTCTLSSTTAINGGAMIGASWS